MRPLEISRALGRTLRCRVAEPDHQEYLSALLLDNGRIRHAPQVVVVPRTVDDVAATVRFAADHGVCITARSGGHGAAGYCLNTAGIVVDMRHLSGMSLEPRSGLLRVGAGARWGQVYEYLSRAGGGKIAVGGACPDVGVGGFLLGGGFGFLSRSYGLGSDNVRSFTLVTASGDVRQVSHAENEDLFWACGGGGGGNFGIVVDVEIETHRPPSATMLVGELLFPFSRAVEILGYYNEWVETIPREMAVYGFAGRGPDLDPPDGTGLWLRLTPVFNGPFTAGEDVLQGLLAQRPARVQLYDMGFHEWERLVGGATLVNQRGAYIRSAMLKPRGLAPQPARTIVDYMTRCPSPATFMVWTHVGGAVEDVEEAATAFPHRRARFVPEIKAIWDASRPADARASVEWAFDFFEELSRDAMGAYVNYTDPLLADWQAKYYGRNYERLLEIKRAWDPDAVFAFPQGIGSTFAASGARPLDLSPLDLP